MKFLTPLFLFTILFWACTDAEAPKDTETNKYYADYMAIYAAYDSVGNAATLEALDQYLTEFPERHEAYNFKAYVLAKMGKVEEAHDFFNTAREMDSLAITSYEYQSALMLHDTTQNDATAALIEQGLSIDDSSGHLMNSRAWLHLLNGDYEEGFDDVITGVEMKPKTKNLYRTGFILSTMLEEDSSALFFADKLVEYGIENPDSLSKELTIKGALEVLKSRY